MCGIVGIISKKPTGFWQSDLKIFKELIWADQLRGTDGTGTFCVDRDGKSNVVKSPTPAYPFLNKDFDNVEKGIVQTGRILIGHNRAATKGTKTWANTHPFKENHISLVHNGTLYTHKHLHDTDVDSHAICHAISKQGYQRTLKELYGAFALVWYNEMNKRLYLVRNKERPLNIVESKDLFVISSEPGLASWILERNKETVTKVTELEVGKLYTFDLSKLEGFKQKKVDLKEETSFLPKAMAYQVATGKNTMATTGTNKLPSYGDKIEFYPLRVFWENGRPHLVGLYEQFDTQIDIIFQGNNQQYTELRAMCDQVSVTGIIMQKREYPNKGGLVEWWVRDIDYVKTEATIKAEEEIKKKTLNNIEVSDKEVVKLEDQTCDMCGGSLNFHYVNKMVVDKSNGVINTVYCHECGPIAEKYNL